jgi:hypothetical protein
LQGLPIKACDGPLHILALSQFDKSEAPRLSCRLIANDYGRSCLKAGPADELTQFTVCHFVGKIPHEQLLRHEMLPMAWRLRFATIAF